jgi:N,N-dimethylformamidase
VVLASSTEHSELMLRTKEELLATRPPMDDPKIRADMVFYETPKGGAVFSVGSIAWYGALPHHGWDNDIARITANVVRRFAHPEPLAPPIV